MAAKTATHGRDVTAELAYLTRALKAPTLAANTIATTVSAPMPSRILVRRFSRRCSGPSTDGAVWAAKVGSPGAAIDACRVGSLPMLAKEADWVRVSAEACSAPRAA